MEWTSFKLYLKYILTTFKSWVIHLSNIAKYYTCNNDTQEKYNFYQFSYSYTKKNW